MSLKGGGFETSLSVGQEVERVVAEAYMQEDGNPVVMADKTKFNKWDFRRDLRGTSSPDGEPVSYETRVEVKWDAYAEERAKMYGLINCNFFFEISSFGKSSGILTTLCDEWAHVVNGYAYIFDPRDLRRLFFTDFSGKTKLGFVKSGGDKNKTFGWLVSYNRIAPHALRKLKLPRPVYVKVGDIIQDKKF